MTDLPPPAGFYAANGNWVAISDAWVEEVADVFERTAEIVDTVTGEKVRFLLTFDEDDNPDIICMRWFRRINSEHYIPTEMYEEEPSPADEDEHVEVVSEVIDNASAELIMAVALCPRYRLEAEWLSDQDREIIRTAHANCDDLDQDEVNARRMQLFGTADLL